jgi:hypothetical protein
MVGNKLSAKEEEAYRNKGTHKPRSPRVTTVLAVEVEVADPGHHHQDDAIVQRTKELDDPEPPTEHMTTKMMKRRWGAMLYP